MNRVAKLYHIREVWDVEARHFEDEVVDGRVNVGGMTFPVDQLVFTRRGFVAATDEEVAEATYLFMIRQWLHKNEGNRPKNMRVWLETEEWVQKRVSEVHKIPFQAIFMSDLGRLNEEDPLDLRMTQRETVLQKLIHPVRYRELALPETLGLN